MAVFFPRYVAGACRPRVRYTVGRDTENPGREVVVDLFGVVPRDRRRREQPFEETGARRGELIQRQGCAREFGEDRQQPGPGRGLEHDVGGRQPRRDARHETERQRG